jgi:nitroreductase
MNRRELLQMIGRGAGVLAVAGAGGLTWRGIDDGVFATGTGAAYEPWSQLGAGPDGPLRLVRAAILAANAHNTQPWRFRLSADRIDVYADLGRTIGAMDPLRRELHVSLGCALENMVVAAGPHGLRTTVDLLPDVADPTHVASIAHETGPRTASPLFEAMAKRHTDRSAYERHRAIPADTLARYRDLVNGDGVTLVWLDASFGDLTVRATEAIIADPQQAADDYRWYRTTWDEIQQRRDGITIDASGQPRPIRALAKLVAVSREQNNAGWLRGTRDTQVATAAAFGALVIADGSDAAQRMRAGRAWQRLHLTATVDGLSLQPLCQVPERVDREESAALTPEFTTAMAGLLPASGRAVMTFRIGYPTVKPPASPRRAVTDVLIGQS